MVTKWKIDEDHFKGKTTTGTLLPHRRNLLINDKFTV